MYLLNMASQRTRCKELRMSRIAFWISVATLLCVALQSQLAVAQGVGGPAPTPAPLTPSMTSPSPSSTGATTCGPRVRKAWGTLSTADKQLYLDAVMAAMANGMHTLFLEVHADSESGTEAHLTCGMIYWHRRFTLAYENMLRSLAPRFACVTIPYWDFFADFAKRTAGFCTTLEGCSTFLSEFGGSGGPSETHVVGNTSITSNCVTSGVAPGTTLTYSNATTSTNFTVSTTFSMASFCENSSTPSARCSKCMPRGAWTTTPFPSGFGYASLTKLVSGSFGFAVFAQNLHYTVHNSIHNAAGATMATLSTSADPIFYSQHATVDLVHQMWYDCQVKRPMTEYEKKTSSYAFAQCSQSTAVTCPSRLANITMFWSSGSDRMRADDHPIIGPFFSPLPTEYWQWVSTADLGAYSYTYEKDALLKSFGDANTAISCPAVSKARRMQVLTSDDVSDGEEQDDDALLLLSNDVDDSSNNEKSILPLHPSANAAVNTDQQRVVAVSQVSMLGTELVNNVMEVVDEQNSDATTPKKIAFMVRQMELMECAWYVEQGNYVDDLTDFYKANMGMSDDMHTNCYNIVVKLLSGAESIELDNWRDVFKRNLRSAKRHHISTRKPKVAPAVTAPMSPALSVAESALADPGAALTQADPGAGLALTNPGATLTLTEEAGVPVDVASAGVVVGSPNVEIASASNDYIVPIDQALTSNF